MDQAKPAVPTQEGAEDVKRMQSTDETSAPTEAAEPRQEVLRKTAASAPYAKVPHVGGSLSSSALFGEMDYPEDDHCEPTEEETDFGESSASFGLAAAESDMPFAGRRSASTIRPASPRIRTPSMTKKSLTLSETFHGSATDVHPRWHMSFKSEIFCEEEEINEESEPQSIENTSEGENTDELDSTREPDSNIQRQASAEESSRLDLAGPPFSHNDDVARLRQSSLGEASHDSASIDPMALWSKGEEENNGSLSFAQLSAENLPGHDSLLWGDGGGIVDHEETGREDDQYYHLQNHGLKIHHHDSSQKAISLREEDDEVSFTLSQLNDETEDDSESSSESAISGSSSSNSDFSLHCDACSITSSVTWSIASAQQLELTENSETPTSAGKVKQPMNPTIGSDCSSMEDNRLGEVVKDVVLDRSTSSSLHWKPMNPTIGETVDVFSKLTVSPLDESDSLQEKR